MLVVFDSNALIADPLLDGNAMTQLRVDRWDGVRFAVPDVVRAEVAHHVAVQIQSHVAAAEKAKRALGRLGVEARWTPTPVQDPAESYLAQLDALLAAHGWTELAWPQVAHEQHLARMHAARGDAEGGPTGYQDRLVWETILEALPADGEVVLVSKDSDFRGSGGRLANRLVEEVAERVDRRVRVQLVATPAELVREVLAPHAAVEHFWHRVGVDRFAIEHAVAHELGGYRLSSQAVQPSAGDVVEAWVAWVIDTSDVEVDDARALADGRVTFAVRLDAFVQLGLHRGPGDLVDESASTYARVVGEGRTTPDRGTIEHMQVVELEVE